MLGDWRRNIRGDLRLERKDCHLVFARNMVLS